LNQSAVQKRRGATAPRRKLWSRFDPRLIAKNESRHAELPLEMYERKVASTRACPGM